MPETFWNCLETLAHLVAAAGLVLLGWRLGRESAGRPMFAFGGRGAEPDDASEEVDPWSAALIGSRHASGGSGEVDIFETLSDAPGFSVVQDAGLFDKIK